MEKCKSHKKSNKFDYSKRSNSGLKLGNIIGRDVQKELDRSIKDAEKAGSKDRKRSTGSSSSSTRDATTAHTIDLQVPAKDLGDDGACAMADGLELAFSGRSPIRLEDLNLSHNGLTTISLARLAPIIRLASHDLKTLNLACNSLKVETAEEAVQWETFLRSFEGCFRLRRLDLSGNANLGSRAFEIMARVHIGEKPVSAVRLCGETSVISLPLEEDLLARTRSGSSGSGDVMSGGGYLKRRIGLRSIPYITLTDVGMDDLSALWLSYILEEHHYPSQLIDGLNATQAKSAIATYQQNTNSRGIDWSKDTSLGRDGYHLLQKAESFREQMTSDDDISDTADSALDVLDGESQTSTTKRTQERFSRALPGDRRASIRSIRTADGGEHESSELESARKRLQRSLLISHGTAKVELWRTALRLVISSRVLVGIDLGHRTSARLYTGPPKFDFTSYSPAATVNRTMPPRPATPRTKLSFESGSSSSDTSSRQGTYASTLITGKNGVSANVLDPPTTPKILLKPNRKGPISEGGDLHKVTQKLERLVVNPQRYVEWQKERNAIHKDRSDMVEDDHRRLPSKVVELIAGLTVTRRENEILSDKQMQAAMSWGQRRANFETEKEWRRWADSSQVWTLLESIGCLAYDKQ